MKLKWPWKPSSTQQRLAFCWSGQRLAYVTAQAQADGRHQIHAIGVEHQGSDSAQAFATRLRKLGLGGRQVHAMLSLEQYQLLQVPAPAVPPEELRAAVRYQIRDMVDSHLDDITLDTMQVGDPQQSTGQLYVVVAKNALLHELMQLSQTAGWTTAVIDIQEAAQRNLQTMQAGLQGLGGKANAALVITGQQALLTICAHGELFYSRRLEAPEGFLDMKWLRTADNAQTAVDSYTPVAEYVPEYASAFDSAPQAPSEDEHVQRFLVEVQRSIDVWDRTWSALPLSGLRVCAGERSADLATWLGHAIGHPVSVMEFESSYPSLKNLAPQDRDLCLPLLGMLMRSNEKTL